jgi:hypothetical protein
LAAEVTRWVRGLADGDGFTIAGLGADGLILWRVWRDYNGVPRYDGPVQGASPGNAQSAQVLARAAQASAPGLVVCTAGEGTLPAQAMSLLREVLPSVLGFHCQQPLEGYLSDACRSDPLTRWYELVVLRVGDDGRVRMGTLPLFERGQTRGDTVQLRVRCLGDEREGRTAFAVVAYEPGGGYRLLSRKSAHVPRGKYELIAELAGPGDVSFGGLWAELRDDERTWEDVVALVPGTLTLLPPAHLIVAIEVSGVPGTVLERIDRAEQLIRCAEDADNRPHVSVVTYGPHAVHRADPEEPVRVLTWAGTGQVALEALATLAERGAVSGGYSRAAQLECMLAIVAERLGQPGRGDARRPALATIGSRSPFPRVVDRATEIIPCPRRRDWLAEARRLAAHPGMTSGIITDRDEGGAHWRELGRDVTASLDAVDIRAFAAGLRLVNGTDPQASFPVAVWA